MWHGQKLSSLNLFAAYLAHVGQILRCLQLRDACAPPPQRPHVSASSKREVNLRVIRNSNARHRCIITAGQWWEAVVLPVLTGTGGA
jgi:hypothetical protein